MRQPTPNRNEKRLNIILTQTERMHLLGTSKKKSYRNNHLIVKKGKTTKILNKIDNKKRDAQMNIPLI